MANAPKDETPYKCNERLGLCQECGKPGKPRVDNGLRAGTHCDPCWDELVTDCRKRSW